MENDSTFARVLAFLEFDDDAKSRGQALGRLLAPHFDAVIDDLYWKVTKARISPRITPQAIEQLKQKQKEHWRKLFGTAFDQTYKDSVEQIAAQHRDIGLDPLWCAASYAFVRTEFTSVIILRANIPTAEKTHFIRCLDKYLAIDMGLILAAAHATAFID